MPPRAAREEPMEGWPVAALALIPCRKQGVVRTTWRGSLTRWARRSFARKPIAPAPPDAPSTPGLTWFRQRQFRAKSAKNELLGARLGRFLGASAKKGPLGARLGAQLEMLLCIRYQ